MQADLQKLYCTYKSAEAFWAAAESVMTDSYSQKMFLRIANVQNHIVQLHDDIDRIKELADNGNPYMQYAFARLHDTLALEAGSSEICGKYYGLALKAGIADARMQLAFMYRDGDLGEVDNRKFRRYLEQALEEGSGRAAQFRLHEMIFGSDYVTANPGRALELIEEYLGSETEDPDPYYYRLKAQAEETLGMKEDAARDYETAAKKGDSESFFLLAVLTCCDEDGNVVNGERFSELMSLGQDAGAASAYLEAACLLTDDIYEALDNERRNEIRDFMESQLSLASMMGEGQAAYLLGSYHEDGKYGFGQDFDKAFQWYSRGALLRSAISFECLSRMILEDGTAPEKYDEEFGYECAYRAYILGADTLECLIRGYKTGHLTAHAAVIEEFYLPIYEQQFADGDYDEPEIEEDCLYDDPEIVTPEYRDCNRKELDTDTMLTICEDTLAKARKAAMEHPQELETLASGYADAAAVLKNYEHLLDRLYSMNAKMLELIGDYPRIKLRISKIQLEVLRWIEARSGHELGIAEDLENEIRKLSESIDLE